MSRRNVVLAFGLVTFAFAGRASAESRTFAFLDSPPPEPAPGGPAPAREGDEYARKSWEAFPDVGFVVPFCRGDSFGAGRCGDNGGGTALGGGALYRVSPYVALGADVSFASFSLGAGSMPAAYSRASFIGFVVRGYFADRGVVDPYVETGVGRGAAVMGYSDTGIDIESRSSGPAAMAGAGIDFWVAPYLKLGPAFSYRWTWLTEVQTCAGTSCETARVADLGAVGSFATVSFVATLALGHEM